MTAQRWATWKLAHAYPRVGSGTTPGSTQSEYYSEGAGTPWITTSELRETYIDRTSSTVTDVALSDYPTLRVYKPGSVLIAMYGATIGRLGMTRVPATCNQACCVFEESTKFDNRFLFYWLWHRRGHLIGLSRGGGQPNLSQQALKEERALCPPLETQRRIARFLDAKTARIDALIAKKRALLERLAEKRQALITQAVTKGLDPNVPMKDSGIDWLGQIPAHWKVKRLRHLTDELLKYGANAAAEFDDVDWPRFVRITDIDEAGELRRDTFRSLPPEVAKDYLLAEQDILLARSGATVGKSFIYRASWEQACFAGYLIRVRLRNDVSPDFVYLMLNSAAYWGWVASSFIQSTIRNIGADKYANLWIALPPERGEQDAIAKAAGKACKAIDDERAMVSDSVTLLTEYRSALITAAVTGQLEISADCQPDRANDHLATLATEVA